MLAPYRKGVDATLALSLAHFLADRIRPPAIKVRIWLDQILGQWRPGADDDIRAAVAVALLVHATDGLPEPASRARRHLVSRGVDLQNAPVDANAVPAFVELIGPAVDLSGFMTLVLAAQTAGEQVRAYLAMTDGLPQVGALPTLERTPHWRTLERAIMDPELKAKFVVFDTAPAACPRCNIAFPRATVEDLRQLGVTSCCGRPLLNMAI